MDEKSVQKKAEELEVGDWLAADQMVDGPAEVLHTLTYRGDDGSPHTHLLIRELGARAPYADVVYGKGLMTLATEAELEALRGSAERAQKIADIRAFADWLEATPDAPAPWRFHVQVSPGQEILPHLDVWNSGAEGMAALRRLAEIMGAEVVHSDERSEATKTFGRVEYRAITWHKDGRPVEPAPEPLTPAPIAEHYQISGSVGGPGENGADCACGVSFTGFDTHAEAQQQLAWHIADPSGQDYGRADTAEQDDPTPVSGARVEPHVGGVLSGIAQDGHQLGEPVVTADESLVDVTPDPDHACAAHDDAHLGQPCPDLTLAPAVHPDWAKHERGCGGGRQCRCDL